jgi:hypothetical protein
VSENSTKSAAHSVEKGQFEKAVSVSVKEKSVTSQHVGLYVDLTHETVVSAQGQCSFLQHISSVCIHLTCVKITFL